jgi:hypothetical protein
VRNLRDATAALTVAAVSHRACSRKQQRRQQQQQQRRGGGVAGPALEWRPVSKPVAAAARPPPAEPDNESKSKSKNKSKTQPQKPAWVRVLVRCPWGGGPVVGAPVLVPTEAQEAAWCAGNGGGGKRGKPGKPGAVATAGTSRKLGTAGTAGTAGAAGTAGTAGMGAGSMADWMSGMPSAATAKPPGRRWRCRGGDQPGSLAHDIESQTAIGFITSASPAGAATGVASAIVDAAALRRLRSLRFHPATSGSGSGATGSGTGAYTRYGQTVSSVWGSEVAFAMLRVPSASPAAVVPACLTVALEASPTDAAWW